MTGCRPYISCAHLDLLCSLYMGFTLDVLGFMVYLIGSEVHLLALNRMSLGYWQNECYEKVVFARSNTLSYYLVRFDQ